MGRCDTPSKAARTISTRTRAQRAFVIVCLVAVSAPIRTGGAAFAAENARQLWFSPNPGSLDLLRMFERPGEWAHARALMSVFNFTQQHTFATADPVVGPNSYAALTRVGAFRQLKQWGKAISLGVGVVKDFYCTPDASGMAEAIRNTQDAIGAIKAAGGAVDYLSMDEPWVSGRAKKCGGPALEPTADRVAAYMSAIARTNPSTRIGLIEAYPFSSAAQIESMLDLMKARGVPPAFLHMDVDWHALGPGEFARDMKRLQAACRSRDIAFGIIITGYNGDADALFAVDAYGIAHLMGQTFGTWPEMPDHIMFDSWVTTSTGVWITPSNLPDTRPFTQTSLLRDIFRYLRGVQGSGGDVSVPR